MTAKLEDVGLPQKRLPWTTTESEADACPPCLTGLCLRSLGSELLQEGARDEGHVAALAGPELYVHLSRLSVRHSCGPADHEDISVE